MITNALYGLLLLVALAFQTSVLTSLTDPYRLFPLTLVIGIVIMYERSLILGGIWIIMAGGILDARGLGEGLLVSSVVATLVSAGLIYFVLSKRSFWSLFGVGGGVALAYVVTKLIWSAGLAAFTHERFDLSSSLRQGLMIGVMITLGVFALGVIRRRLLTWSQQRFMRKENLYAISLPEKN